MSSHRFLIANRKILEGFNDGVLVEIGSERGQGSTPELARFASDMKMEFITVDADDEISAASGATLKKMSLPGTAVCDLGENFLRKRTDPIHAIYLDAFDFWHPHHSDSRKKAYAKRGTEITNENCWKMHLDCSVELVRLMPSKGVVCFDDILDFKNWAGKGKLAIPFLLDNGFRLFKCAGQAVILIKG